ncbi:hypothetical protein L21SP3_00491 [Sedimentisphaera cyanobacteriorum]|uniref:Peptidase M60 domain-containing protein n=1 Tax=Sedimentisphaera cyanobacteriorum TaxID=1940790 RepID=A0A1Q2HMN7_9BACT|nr:M60 family metallopeptidase [Sedimentisphaera cyanobacteriorum]AQQ08702.1 hypothetical protein L21SP3_00491 [Sedimentisphaera cyanobacteriorum]
MIKKTITAFLMLAAVCIGGYGELLKKDFAKLTENVQETASPGVPGPVCIFRPYTIPICVSGNYGGQKAAAAAGRTREGRFVCFGHGGYLNPSEIKKADTSVLFENCVKWLAGTEGRAKAAVIGNKPLCKLFEESHYDARNVSFSDTDKIMDSDLLVFDAGGLKKQHFKLLDKYLKDGNGIMTAMLGWGWKQVHSGKDLREECPANDFFSQYGVVWADGYLEPNKNGFMDSPDKLRESLNSLLAFEQMKKLKKSDDKLKIRQIGESIELAALSLPSEEPTLMQDLKRIARSRSVIPTGENPVTANDVASRAAITVYSRNIENTKPEQIKPHASAKKFPGAVKNDAPRVIKEIEIDLSVPRWHSTGLYAPAGKVIEADLTDELAKKGLNLRIGSHKDKLWHKDAWKRFPDITSSLNLSSNQTKAASAFGGLIYIDVPEGLKGKANIMLKGAVQAPYFELGKTNNEQWEEIRRRPAPWGELMGRNVVITVPSEKLRKLEDPSSLMQKWDEVFDACAELRGSPAPRLSCERIVPDVQISAGYMHSGYPIMTQSDQFDTLADINTLKNGSWGLFHEIGHNHQRKAWTFSGATEVTVNIFTVYVFDKVCGIAPIEGRMNARKRQQLKKEFNENGGTFAYWKKNPFVGLLCYLELQEEFGWEPYKKVFRKYEKMDSNELPKNDSERINRWVLLFSQTVKKNLVPFFRGWGWPVSEETAGKLKNLPVWPEIDSESGEE